MDEGKREVRIISLVSYCYYCFFNIMNNIYATFPLSMSFSLRERIGGVRSKTVLEISTELHVSASSSPWK